MKGTIVKRPGGYSIAVDLGKDPITGKRRRPWHSGYTSKREATVALAELVACVNNGTYVPRGKSRRTVAEFTDEWLTLIAPTVRPGTHASYARNIRTHLLPYLGTSELGAIDGECLNHLYALLLSRGGKARHNTGQGLSPRTVRYVHTIAHRLFKDAIRWGKLATNPCDRADPPKPSATRRKEFTIWTLKQTRWFLDQCTQHELGDVFFTLATTGLRRGEALGLRWSDMDLDGLQARIAQTIIEVNRQIQVSEPKTYSGRRTIALDAHTAHVLGQRTQTKSDLVFTTRQATPLHPENVSRRFKRFATKLGLPKIRLHDLRHGWATHALAADVPAKVVQEQLGHANVSITLDIYSHPSSQMQAKAVKDVADLFFPGES